MNLYDRHYVHTFFEELIAELEQRERMGTTTSYRSTLTIFRKFANPKDCRFEDLNERVLAGFERYLRLSEL